MNEQIQFHGFPIAGVDPMRASTARSFPRHTHDQFGVGVVDDGRHASWSDSGAVEAGPGDFITVNPGEVHDGRARADQRRTWRILYFEPSLLESLRSDVADTQTSSFRFQAPVFSDGRLLPLFNQLFRFGTAPANPSSGNMPCETATLLLIAGLRLQFTGKPDNLPRALPSVRRALARIDADPAAPLTLAELASEAGVSRFQLLRGFARELGLTPHAYVIQQRIALARRLIRARVPLPEAALASGFCDQSHLHRCFLRQFGVTPGRYATYT
jgi:AraC-like DNA-binding protein